MLNKFRIQVLIVIGLGLLSQGLWANTSFEFSGIMNEANFLPGIPVGAPFTGSFTYSLSDQPGFPGASFFPLTSPGDGLVIQVAGMTFIAPPSESLYIALSDGYSPTQDLFSVIFNCQSSCPSAFGSIGQIAVQFYGNSSLLSSSTTLPDNIDPNNVTYGSPTTATWVSISTAGTVFPYDLGDITSLTETPEPESFGLVFAGLASLALRTWRRRAR